MAENEWRLLVEGMVTGYGKKQVLHGLTLSVAPGEIVAVIGHNGAGKSTLLRAIFGLTRIWKGCLILDGTHVDNPRPRELLERGVAYVPQGNRVFPDLTVYENLELGGTMVAGKEQLKAGIERVSEVFPALKLRFKQRAGTLSGGEKQMLALANAIILMPRLMLLDEPSLGLAPPLVTEALERIRQISLASNTSVLIVEQKVREVLRIAARVYVVRGGHISFSGQSEVLRDESRLKEVYL